MAQAAVLGIAALATSAVGTGISVYGQMQQASAQKRMANYNAKVAENEAIRVQQEGQEERDRQRREHRRLIGRQRTQIAKSGLQETGSPLAVLAENAGMLELQAQDQRRATNARAQQLRTQGQITRAQGNAAYKAGMIGAGSTLFRGLASTGMKHYGFKKSGVY